MKLVTPHPLRKSNPVGPRFSFKAKIWLYEGKAAWYFASLPKGMSAKIKAIFGGMKRGWGSLPVLVTLGKTQWRTSIFPDSKRGAYLLPLKAEVRRQEKAKVNDTRFFQIELQL